MPLPNVFVVTKSQPYRPRLHRGLRALRAISALSLGLCGGFVVAHASGAVTREIVEVPIAMHQGASSIQRGVSTPAMATARYDARMLLAAAHRYRARVGTWPAGLEALRRHGEIQRTIRDPWGGRYRFFFDQHRTRAAVCASGRPQMALTAVCFW